MRSNATVAIMLMLPLVLGMVVVSVNAAHMAGPAILPPPPSKQCDTATSSSSSNTWFGIPIQRRYITTTNHKQSCSAASVVRGGASDNDDDDDDSSTASTQTIHTPSSVAELDALLIKAGNEQQLVVIDFTASWCGPCQTIAPKVKKLNNNRRHTRPCVYSFGVHTRTTTGHTHFFVLYCLTGDFDFICSIVSSFKKCRKTCPTSCL